MLGARKRDATAFWARLAMLLTVSLWAVTTGALYAAVGRATSRRVVVEEAAPALQAAYKPATPASKGSPESAMAATDSGEPLLDVPRLFEALGMTSRDPEVLLATAERLAASGFDITVLRVRLSAGAAENIYASRPSPTRVLPVHSGGHVAGIRIDGSSPDSLPIMVGLENGDVITSMNAIAMTSPEQGLEALRAAQDSGIGVIEALRGRRRIIVGVSWPVRPVSASPGAPERKPGASPPAPPIPFAPGAPMPTVPGSRGPRSR